MPDLNALQAQALELFAIVVAWLTSPTFYAQIAAIVISWLLAIVLARMLNKRVSLLNTAPGEGKLLWIRELIYRARHLAFPALLVGTLAIALPVLRSVTGSIWLVQIAQSLALVLVLYNGVKLFIAHDGLRKIVNLVVLPSALLMVFGQFEAFTGYLDTVALELGNIRVSALFLIKGAIFGAIIFWLGRQSNAAGQSAIHRQESLDLGMRSLISKLFQILLFIVMGIVFLQVLGIDLTALAVLGGAVGVGLGFGLQQIAANFISGMIILFERSLQPGDYIEMEDGRAGILKEINMRSTTLETYDGKEVMLPNEKFITTTFVNWTRDDPRQRYEVEFSVAYDTDIEIIPDLIAEAVSKHPQVLSDPEPVDVELRGFGDSSINFAVEFWADGIDDGKNKFSSDVLFIVWRTLKGAGIGIPFPQREVRILSDETKLSIKKKAAAKAGS